MFVSTGVKKAKQSPSEFFVTGSLIINHTPKAILYYSQYGKPSMEKAYCVIVNSNTYKDNGISFVDLIKIIRSK